jgi:hypothetical protein
MWNFGSLDPFDMGKYVSKMVSVLNEDLPGLDAIKLVL